MQKSKEQAGKQDGARSALFMVEDSENQEKELLQIVDEAFETALRKFRRIEPVQPATLHRLRVLFKKIPDMVEIVQPGGKPDSRRA